MAESKLTNTKVPDRKPKAPPKKLGLLTKGNRRMSSFRMKYGTIEILDTLVKKGKDNVSEKMSSSDIIEASLHLLSQLEKEQFNDYLLKCMRGEIK
jgi:hypothetical protein